MHLRIQQAHINSQGLPRIASVPPSTHMNGGLLDHQISTAQMNSEQMSHSVSQEFQVHHVHAAKRPAKKHAARRIKYFPKNQKIVDNRNFLQKLAMNYYGARPTNYLARNSKNQSAKSQQIMAILNKGSLNSTKAQAKQRPTDPRAMKHLQKQK